MVPPGGKIAFQAIMYQIGPQIDEKPHFVQWHTDRMTDQIPFYFYIYTDPRSPKPFLLLVLWAQEVDVNEGPMTAPVEESEVGGAIVANLCVVLGLWTKWNLLQSKLVYK